MDLQAVYAFVLAAFISTALVPPLARLARPLGLTDSGGGRKIHQGVIPRTGGIAVFIGFLVPVLLWVPIRTDIGAFLSATGVLFVFGVLDDRFNLDYRLKFLGQGLAALIVTLYGGVIIQHFPFLPDHSLPGIVALPFTVIVLVGVTNAVNLSDGLDGLAGGISLLAIGCLLLLAHQGGDGPVAVTSLAVIGATFGFLRFNTFPARIFMGDTGSQFLGFSAAVLAVIVTQHSDPALSPVVPLLILGLPIFDMLTVMIRRIAHGRSPFEADRTHIHHKLLECGLNQYEAVSLVYSAQFLLVVIAYVLRYSSDISILVSYFAFCMLGLIGIRALQHSRQRFVDRAECDSATGRLIAYARKTKLFTQVPYVVVSVAIPLFLMAGSLAANSVDKDIGVLSAILGVTLLLALTVREVPFYFVERFASYATAVTVAYLVESSDGFMEAYGLIVHSFLILLALVTAFWVRFSSTSFKTSSLDILIILIAITVPSIPALGFQSLGIVALDSIVLFYAIEVLIQERARHWDMLRLGVLGALTILTVRGFLG